LAERLKLGVPANTVVVANEMGVVPLDHLILAASHQGGQVRALAGGCLGCEELDHFLQVIDQVREEGARHLILETTGGAWGPECREAFEKAHAPWQCAVVVNVRDFDADRAMPILESQVKVANVAVVLTHLGDSSNREDNRLIPVLAQLAAWNDHLPEVILMPDPREDPAGATRTAGVLKELFDSARHHEHHHEPEDHDHGDHEEHEHHDHEHTHAHGRQDSVTISLRDDINLGDLAAAIAEATTNGISLRRAKGVINVEGEPTIFNTVHRDLALGDVLTTPTPSFGVFIANSPDDQPRLEQILSPLARPQSSLSAGKSSYFGKNVSPKWVQAAIEKAIGELSLEGPRYRDSRLRGRSEAATTCYYLGVNAEKLGLQILAHRAIETYVEWNIATAKVADLSRKEDTHGAFNLGRILAWAATSIKSELFSKETLDAVWELQPLTLCLTALLKMEADELKKDAVTRGDLLRWPKNGAARVIRESLRDNPTDGADLVAEAVTHGFNLVSKVSSDEPTLESWDKLWKDFARLPSY
jgi:G3E family GTPase